MLQGAFGELLGTSGSIVVGIRSLERVALGRQSLEVSSIEGARGQLASAPLGGIHLRMPEKGTYPFSSIQVLEGYEIVSEEIVECID